MPLRKRILTAAAGFLTGAVLATLVMHWPLWVALVTAAIGAVAAACLAVILFLVRLAIVTDGGMYD